MTSFSSGFRTSRMKSEMSIPVPPMPIFFPAGVPDDGVDPHPGGLDGAVVVDVEGKGLHGAQRVEIPASDEIFGLSVVTSSRSTSGSELKT